MTMYTVFAFCLFVVGVLAEDDKIETCSNITPGVMACCESTNIAPEMLFLEEVEACYAKKEDIMRCDADKCLAKKLGYYDDGKLDRKAFASLMEKKFENEPQIFDSFKKNCLDLDVSKRGPPEVCDFTKMNVCVHFNFKESCSKWSDEGKCKGVKDLVELCS